MFFCFFIFYDSVISPIDYSTSAVFGSQIVSKTFQKMNFSELFDINIVDYLKIINYDSDESFFSWLKEKKLIARSRQCQKCWSNMSFQKKSSVLDKKIWRCTNGISLYK